MIRAVSVVPVADAEAIDHVVLAYDARHRRRVAMVSDGGTEFLLDLPETRLLQHGEGLVLDDGRVIEVRAAPEPLYEVRARDARHLTELAWHLGNRHLPTQVEADRLLIGRDHVIKAMLEGLGATVTNVEEPFTPARGAYHAHSHSHG